MDPFHEFSPLDFFLPAHSDSGLPEVAI